MDAQAGWAETDDDAGGGAEGDAVPLVSYRQGAHTARLRAQNQES